MINAPNRLVNHSKQNKYAVQYSGGLDVSLFQAYEQSNIQVPGRGWLFVFSMSVENKLWDEILIIAEWQVISYLV